MAESIVYMTCENMKEAEDIGLVLVERRLAACVNILPGMNCIYWWEGKVERAEEVVLIAKTRDKLMDALVDKVKSVHSYEVPCILALPVVDGNPDFLHWIEDETKDE
jgi:periplasmic divalent cation tolerance protein